MNPHQLHIRKSAERGYANHGWLESYHSFSFADYFDRAHMGYSVLRVINDDVIAPAQGFGMHPHQNMEIITYMLQGELRHKDSMGNTSVIQAGDVQCMTAGTGVMHSEFNASDTSQAHLLQIWIRPEREALAPSYTDKHFTTAQKQDAWRLIVSNDGRENSLKIHQDIALYASVLSADKTLDYALAPNRSVYVQVAAGDVAICGQRLLTGDALMLAGEKRLAFKANAATELLLFDLPLP